MGDLIRLSSYTGAGIDLRGGVTYRNPDLDLYEATVAAGGGSVSAKDYLASYEWFLQTQGLLANTKVLWSGDMGRIIDSKAPGDTISKAFSADIARNDLVQATKDNQPLRVGQVQGIAEGLYNPTGGSRFITHPAVSFAADQPWSLIISVNWNGRTSSAGQRLFGNTDNLSALFLDLGGNNMLFRNQSGSEVLVGSNLFAGKNTVIAFVADGAGKLTIIINNVAIKYTTATDFVFTLILKSYTVTSSATLNVYRLQSGALTASQVAAEAALLQAQYPAIPSVTIGTQTWAVRNFDAVCTPMGNVIPEVTDNAAWGALTTPAWCHYANNPVNGAIYGKLYNWYAVKQIDDDLAATGSEWRVPTQAQVEALATFLGGVAVAGGKMKMAGTSYWTTPNTDANNVSGFFAIPGGRRVETGAWANLGMYSWFSCVTNIGISNTTYYCNNESAALGLGTASGKVRGLSLRLIKNL